MNSKIIEDLHANFVLDERHNLQYVVREADGREKRRLIVTNSMDKGYIYAALYFYQSYAVEVEKLEKTVRMMRDEVVLEQPSLEASILMLYISRRVREMTGNDNLDALIKEVLADEMGRHMGLVPDKDELEKYQGVKEAIFTEILSEFTNETIGRAVQSGSGKQQIVLSPAYTGKMTEVQKAIYAPAVKMAAFLFGFKLEEFELLPGLIVSARAKKLEEPFDATEEEIKKSIKKFIAAANAL